DAAAVCLARVDRLLRAGQPDRSLLGGGEVTAPPVEVVVDGLDTLDDDEPVRVDLEDGVPGPLGGQAPVGGPVAVAPGRLASRLVVQVRPDHQGVVTVVL